MIRARSTARSRWLILAGALLLALKLWSSLPSDAAIEPIYTLPYYTNANLACAFHCYYDPTYGWHEGTDYVIGTPGVGGAAILAAAGGTAKPCAPSFTAGNYIVIDHSNGHRTRYLHLNSLPLPADGQAIARGSVIGYEGNTGYTIPPGFYHLHFETRVDATTFTCGKDGTAVDPYAGSTYLWTTDPPSYPPNLLTDPSFDEGNVCNTCAWQRFDPPGGTTDWGLLPGGYSGSQFLQFNAAPVSPGASIYQDVAINPSPGESYTFSAWVKNGSNGCVAGAINLWGLGSSDSSSTSFSACGGIWTPVSAPLDVQYADTALRAQIYVGQPNAYLDVDAAQLISSVNLLTNPSFDSCGTTPCGWGRFDPPGGTTNWTIDSGGYNGQRLRFSASPVSAGSSIYQDVAVNTSPDESYSFSAWVRNGDGVCVAGSIVLWGLGSNESSSTQFSVCGTWTQVSAPLDVRYADTGLRAQIYVGQPNTNLDVDVTHVLLLSSPPAPVDSDGDGIDNSVDNCRFWYNPAQALPSWSVPAGDKDCDGFPDSVPIDPPNALASETFMGTDPASHCAADNSHDNEPPPDRWPVDFNDDQLVSGGDFLAFGPVYGAIAPDPRYDARFDVNGDGRISGGDFLVFAPFFGKRCA